MIQSSVKRVFEETGYKPLQVPTRRQEVTSIKNLNLEAEVAEAQKHLELLKEALGPDSRVQNITESELRNSRVLRTTIMEYKEFFFFMHNNDPRYLNKKYTNEEQRDIDNHQSVQQSAFQSDLQRFQDNLDRNVDLMADFVRGEEGVDYQVLPGKVDDPRYPSEKLLEKQLRKEINRLKLEDPQKAKEYEEFLFKRNEFDEAITAQVDLSEVKIYPGSEKGPRPEDDAENYSRWFIENQPKKIYQGEHHEFEDIGAKRKYVQMVRDLSENNEQKTPINYFQEEDEIYPLASYQGQPEFSIFERDRYNVENDDELPSVSISTNL